MSMFDEYRFMEPGSKTPQQLIEYLVEQKQPEYLTLVMELLRHNAEQYGELVSLRRGLEDTHGTK